MKNKLITAYFILVDNDLNENVIGKTTSSNYYRQFILFLDKKFGKDNWEFKSYNKKQYAFIKRGEYKGCCLVHSPFEYIV